MNDLIEKLRAILSELGIEPEKIEAAVAALSEESEGGNDEKPSTPEEPTTEEETPAPSDETPSEGEETVVTPQEGEPADPASVPPVPPEGEVPPVDEPPVDPNLNPSVPPVPPELPPMVSLEEFNAVKAELVETKKALDGVNAKCDSLLEALKGAGVISKDSATEVGDGTPTLPNNGHVNTAMDDVLAEINRKHY